jgi:predicted dehydrogenase
MRRQLHYEWHWFWATGNGEMGNNGVHVIDLCRWALGQNQAPPQAMSIGGRFDFNDCGETANTQIALFNYQPAPLICEVRNVRRAGSGDAGLGKFKGRTQGIIITCEGGYFAGDTSGGAMFDNQGKKMADLTGEGDPEKLVTSHFSKFLAAVRSRKSSDLAAEALEGHVSTSCCHLANISHRIGKQSPPEAIHAAIEANRELADAFDRCRQYLSENGVDLSATPATLGPWITFDPKQERFLNDFADQANALVRRDCREPYLVPQIA